LIAVEPSREMIRKRSPAAAEAIEASADDLLTLDAYEAGYRLVVADRYANASIANRANVSRAAPP
jgi:hypothetical protein